MKLSSAIRIFGGGPGSGCHGDNCGRPEGNKEHNYKAGSVITQVYDTLKSGEWQSRKELESKFGVSAIADRLRTLSKHGSQNSKWSIEHGPNGMVRMVKSARTESVDKPSDKPSKSSSDNDVRKVATEKFDRVWYGKGPLPGAVTTAIEKLATVGIDPRCLTVMPLRGIDVSSNPFGYGGKGGAAANAWYNTKIARITLVKDGRSGFYSIDATKWNRADTFIHEFGHHLDLCVFDNREHPNDAIDWHRVHDLRFGADHEYRQEKERFESKYGSDTKSYYQQPTKGPSHYALTNRKEWFAESFMTYYGPKLERERLEKNQPRTFKFIDEMVKGNLFK